MIDQPHQDGEDVHCAAEINKLAAGNLVACRVITSRAGRIRTSKTALVEIV
jgi:hypothetical protein